MSEAYTFDKRNLLKKKDIIFTSLIRFEKVNISVAFGLGATRMSLNIVPVMHNKLFGLEKKFEVFVDSSYEIRTLF